MFFSATVVTADSVVTFKGLLQTQTNLWWWWWIHTPSLTYLCIRIRAMAEVGATEDPELRHKKENTASFPNMQRPFKTCLYIQSYCYCCVQNTYILTHYTNKNLFLFQNKIVQN